MDRKSSRLCLHGQVIRAYCRCDDLGVGIIGRIRVAIHYSTTNQRISWREKKESARQPDRADVRAHERNEMSSRLDSPPNLRFIHHKQTYQDRIYIGDITGA